MGEDYISWPSHPLGDWQLPESNSLDDPLDLELGLGQPSRASRYTCSNANLISTNQPSPPHMQAGENKPRGWFYCFPRYRQAFVPLPNSGIMKQLPSTYEDIRQVTAHVASPNSGRKRFIVFDQPGDRKSLFVSSFAAWPPIRPLSSWSPATDEACNMSPQHPGIELPISHVVPTEDDVNESHGADAAGSELHEDTEELNALLYSDDDDSEGEDDEKSTGHSPSPLTNHNNSEWIEGPVDTSSKRQKLSDGGYAAPSPLADSADSEEPNRYVEFNDNVDDAESSCADSLNARLEKMCSFAGNRWMRNKKIRETVGVLQSIIPSGKGDNAVVILDEAIQYLKSLKRKAKTLGFNQE